MKNNGRFKPENKGGKLMGDWETPVAVHSKCGETGTQIATNTIDGDITTSWAYYTYLYHWIIFDMGEPKEVTKIRLFQSTHEMYRWGYSDGFCLYVSDNPEDFGTPVWEGVLDAAGWQESGWFSKKGRYIKLLSKCRSIAQETIYEFNAYIGPPPPDILAMPLATVGGVGLGAVVGYVSKREKPLARIIIGAVAGGIAGFIIDRLRTAPAVPPTLPSTFCLSEGVLCEPLPATAEVPSTLAEKLAQRGYTPTKAARLTNGRYTPTSAAKMGRYTLTV